MVRGQGRRRPPVRAHEATMVSTDPAATVEKVERAAEDVLQDLTQ